MGYAGGTVTQPILGGFDDLSKMLLEGSSKIAQINLEISKRRDDQAASLAESISKITSTGLTTHDRLIREATRDAVTRLADLHKANRRGLIGLSDVSAGLTQLDSEVTMLSNMSKLQDENIKNVMKGVEDGDLDSISVDMENALWYNDPNLKSDIFQSPAINSDGSYKRNPDGSIMMVSRPSIEGLQTKRIDGVMHVVKLKEVPARDDNGNPIFNPDTGAPVTTTKTFTQPLTEFLNPAKKNVLKYDLTDDVKNFKSIVGNRVRFIDKNTGELTDSPYNQLPGFDSGTNLYGYTVAPENFPDMIREVESYIGNPKDDEVISILHSFMGAKADFQPDYNIPRSAEEVNQGMMMDIVVNGETTTLPKYYDMNGDVLSFTSDPLDLQTDGSGKIQITNEQRELAKAFKRDKMLKSFNVSYKDYKDYLKTGSTASGKVPPTASYNPATWTIPNPSGSGTVQASINQDYINNRLNIAAANIGEVVGTTSAGTGANFENIHSRGQKIPSTETLTNKQKIISERSSDIIGGFNVVYKSTPIKTQDAIMKYVTQDLKGTTLTGGNLQSLNNVLVFDEGYDPKSGKNIPGMVVLEGDVDFAKTSMAAGTPSIAGGDVGLQRAEIKSGKDFYIVDSSELPSLYQMLWNQGSGPKSFRSILKSAGYNSDGELGGKQNWLSAFKLYTEAIN
jgi:hypothetical protein